MIELTGTEERWLSAMAALDDLAFMVGWAELCDQGAWVEQLGDLIGMPQQRLYALEVPWYVILLDWGDMVRWIRDQHS